MTSPVSQSRFLSDSEVPVPVVRRGQVAKEVDLFQQMTNRFKSSSYGPHETVPIQFDLIKDDSHVDYNGEPPPPIQLPDSSIDPYESTPESTPTEDNQKSLCGRIKDYIASSWLFRTVKRVIAVVAAILGAIILGTLGLAGAFILLPIALPLAVIASLCLAFCELGDQPSNREEDLS